MTLPSGYAARKAIPIFDGAVMYFPDALAAVAQVSAAGNAQHNPGEKLHWARGKSMDQYNTALRHLIDHAQGNVLDTDGTRHLAKAAWRVLAALQLSIEAEHADEGRVVDRDGCESNGGPGAELVREQLVVLARNRDSSTPTGQSDR